MRTKSIIFLISFMLTLCCWMGSSHAEEFDNLCADQPKINIWAHVHEGGDLQELFALSGKPLINEAYLFCFESKTVPAGVEALTEVNDLLILEVPSDTVGQAVYIDGLMLKVGDNFTEQAILKVVNNSSINVYVSNLKIANEAAGDFSCLDVSGNTTVHTADISNCGVGIKADATTSIENSSVYSNFVGIEGSPGAKVKHTLSYGNDDSNTDTPPEQDAIRIARSVIYYEEVKKNGISTLREMEANDAGLVEYGNKKPYIALPEELGEAGGEVELYKTDGSHCEDVISLGQACGYADDGVTGLVADLISQDMGMDVPLSNDILLQDDSGNRKGVWIYTSHKDGSTTLSKPFITQSDVVAFVPPYEIPTSSPNNDGLGDFPGTGGWDPSDGTVDPDTEKSGNSNSVDGGFSASSGCSGSLIAANHVSVLQWGMGMWWVVIIVGLLGTLRMAVVKIERQ
jgi:hypothetical protein